MTFIGIDPGLSGGIAWTGPDGIAAEKMPETEADILRLLAAHARDAVAVIERVHAFPKAGVVPSFNLGRSYGFLRGCLFGLGIPFVEVTPVKWQTALGCLTKGNKNVSKARAQQLYPHLQISHATADALLLATYCARHDWRGVRPSAA